ncbi:MAG: phage major capsid protein, partial [Acutalibacteraceae bacterium]|nr:phage major capsid protein [Acutalibacteraceae bacterium]
MTKEIYLNKRKALVDEAQACIDNSDMKGYAAKEKELKKLDEDFEAQATAQANLNALNGNVSSKAAEFYANKAEPSDDFGSLEYRKAFMNYVAQRTPIPDNFSNAFQNVTTSTGDVSPVIPTTVLNRIVEKMENIGTVLNLVTRTNYKGG